MPTADELHRRFTDADYFRQMDACREHGLGWALVHLVLVLPDICASLAHPAGDARGPGYKAWCDANEPDAALTGADWWAMRNTVLHLGRTIPNREESQYEHFEFEAPNGTCHKQPTARHGGIIVNVGSLHDAILAKMHCWFERVERGEAEGAQYVRKNLELLVRVKPRVRESGESVDANVTSVGTTTSEPSFDTLRLIEEFGLKKFPPDPSSNQ